MNEPWLRDMEGAWISSPQDQGVHNLYVNELMIPNGKMWDRGKIESLFPMHVASRILDIPLFDMLVDDKLVWVDSSHGDYNVKSGYKILLNATGYVMSTSQQEDWSSLWNILAPPKTKHLLWRISKGCFPTRQRLQEKHVPCPLLCPICNNEEENDRHVLFGCTDSMQAWQIAGLGEVLSRHIQHGMEVSSAIHAICSREEKETAGLFAMVAWVLWNNRNNKVWNDVAEPGRSLGFKAKHLWEEWFVVNNQQASRSLNTQQQHPITWQKPSQGWYKCNVDAGFHKDLRKTSTGWCLRDHTGRFIKAETTWRDGLCSILEGESIALIEALHALEQQGITHVIIETDSKSVVDAIRHVCRGSSEFSLFISQINNILSCNPNFMVKFIKRQANMVAHTLARAAISQSRRCTFDSLPLCIATLLSNEMI
jgi:ribonuclease HI